MEREPLQPIERRHDRLTAEQEAHASAEINRALEKLDEQHPVIDTDTARLIASCLHLGHGSLLERFAATGRLAPAGAAKELGAQTDINKLPWIVALGRYLQEIAEPSPDLPPPDFREPSPEVFLSPPDSLCMGQWVEIATQPRTLEASLDQLDPHWLPKDGEVLQQNRRDWIIGNIVGFHDLEFDEALDLPHIKEIARGLAKYGEAFAAFTSAIGHANSSRAWFLKRYVASYPNMTAAVEDFAYAYHLLNPLSSPGEERTREPVNARLIERGLRESFICKQERRGLHMFSHLGDGSEA